MSAEKVVFNRRRRVAELDEAIAALQADRAAAVAELEEATARVVVTEEAD